MVQRKGDNLNSALTGTGHGFIVVVENPPGILRLDLVADE
jgi:hypothetical protein